jgi:hypothetical protein
MAVPVADPLAEQGQRHDAEAERDHRPLQTGDVGVQTFTDRGQRDGHQSRIEQRQPRRDRDRHPVLSHPDSLPRSARFAREAGLGKRRGVSEFRHDAPCACGH